MDKIVVPQAILRQMYELARVFRKNPTPSEAKLWAVLRDRRLDDVKFRRQRPFGPFVVDFLCASHLLIVEVDGPIHEAQREHDAERQRLLEACGYRVLRVTADEVTQRLPDALSRIRLALQNSSPPLHSVERGEGGEVPRTSAAQIA